MNFSQFSKNKLNKEQMLAVKGGKKTCSTTLLHFSWGADLPITTCDDINNGTCWRSIGISYEISKDNWGWIELEGKAC